VSYRWPNKDPDEVLDYSVDWSRYLGSATITSVTWYVDNADGDKTAITTGQIVNGIQSTSQSNTTTVATIYLGSGTNNIEYKFYCSIADSTGSVTERSIKLRVKEQ